MQGHQKKSAMQKLFKVLVVEDNPAIQCIHKAMLTELNCETEVASNAKEALEMAWNHHDLILLDIGLPDRSGVEVALEIRGRETDKRTRIVAVRVRKVMLQKIVWQQGSIRLFISRLIFKNLSRYWI